MDEFEKLVRRVAYGAVKYADLSNRRTNDYRFSLKRMLQFNGDTAVYLLYAYVRISGIIRNSGIDPSTIDPAVLILEHPDEIKLSKLLSQWPEVLDKASSTLEPHILCNYLYKVSHQFHSFFTHCRCLHYDVKDSCLKDVNLSRLLLVERTREMMAIIFELLGIETVEKM